MASMLGNETHRYDFDEVSGLIIDKVGSKDSTSDNGTLVYNGETVSADGVSARMNWSTDAGVSPWVWNDAGGTAGYIHFVNQEGSAGQNGLAKVISGVESGASGPAMNWDDLNATNALRCSLHQTLQTVDIELGREMNVGEAFVWAWSRNNTGAFIFVIKSDGGIDLSETGSGATALNDRAWSLGGNPAGTSHFKADFAQVGTVIGAESTLVELQADCDTLLASSAPAVINRSMYKDTGAYKDNGLFKDNFGTDTLFLG